MKLWLALSALLISATVPSLAQVGSRPSSQMPVRAATPAAAAPAPAATANKAAAPAQKPAAATNAATAPAPVPPSIAAGAEERPVPVQGPTPQATAPQPTAPQLPLNVVFRPHYLTTDIAHYAGLCFRVRQESTQLDFLVAPYFVFGPAAELKEQMTPEQISSVVVAAIGVSINDPIKLAIAQRYIGPGDARVADAKGAEADLAIFQLTAGSNADPTLLLDPMPPINGDRVWIYVKYPGSQKAGLEAATIAWVSPTEIRYHFDNPKLDIGNTAGAPLLSPEGTVVGMHLGTFRGKTGNLYGFACPSLAIRRVIDNYSQPKPQKPKKSLLN